MGIIRAFPDVPGASFDPDMLTVPLSGTPIERIVLLLRRWVVYPFLLLPDKVDPLF